MQAIYDKKAPKKATNLSINSDLLQQSKRLKINLSATLESELSKQLRKSKRKEWLQENKKAIIVLNNLVEENGLFSDSYRTL